MRKAWAMHSATAHEINLSFDFSTSWIKSSTAADLSLIDEMTLRYKTFLGDQKFIAKGTDFSARWGWVPILDFAACLMEITERLKQGESELVFEFTESDSQIHFNRQGENV